MSIRLTGQLLSPTDGSPAANGQIRFISLQGTGKVPKGAIAIEAADANGDYDFTLEFGRFSVEIRQADKFVKQGAVSVNADTPTPLEVGELLEYTEPLTPGQIIYVEQLTAQAEAAAQAASVSQSAANSSAMAASNSAAAAKSEADRASEITGLDTVEEAIDLTLAKTLGLMTETEAMAQADAYEQMFAASGMVHMGKQMDGGSWGDVVNEGISTYQHVNFINSIGMGAHNGVYWTGSSKTDFPVAHIAGAVMNVLGIAADSTHSLANVSSQITLPPAEAGTRVYDSTGDVRGSGEATLDFRYDPDPKYGAAPTGTEAEILREAVGRAFEGDIKNGDFRLGNANGWVTYGTGNIAVNNGVATMTGTFVYQVVDLADLPVGTECEVQLDVGEATDSTSWNLQVNFGGGLPIVDLLRNVDAGVHTVKFTVPAGASTNQFEFHTRNNSLVINSVSVRKVTEEVVTHRSDVATWESYDEELTGRKEIMECIQSLSTTFGDTDVPTVLSTRPNSYFDQYDGQSADPDAQNTKYRCVVWDDLTDEQKRKVAAYMGNKLYVGENGNLVNRRLRARTFRGLGNGDWNNIDSADSTKTALQFGSGILNAVPQGIKDSVDAFTYGGFPNYVYLNKQNSSNPLPHKGAFTAGASVANSVGYKGRCFMYVVASVPRANMGAYVKGLNEFGVSKLLTVNLNSHRFWYEDGVHEVKTLADCFIYKSDSGDIASGISGHPDGIFYDGITAGGLNGVIDWRLPAEANDSPEEQSKVQGKVENKTFRGLEKLVWSQVVVGDLPNNTTNQYFNMSDADIPEILAVGDRVWVKGNGVNTYSERTITGISTDTIALNAPTSKDASNPILVSESKTNLSVSGEFNTSMVIGDPANILQTDALKDGWLGTWCPVIPDGTAKDIYLTRKALSTLQAVSTDDNGVNWRTNGWFTPFDSVVNGREGTGTTLGQILVLPYTAYAKVTEPCENKPVYGVESGVMNVLTSNSHEAESATFFESLLGKVPTHSGDVTYHEHLALRKIHFEDDGRLKNTDSGNRNILHEPTVLTHLSDTPALKVLPYQIAENEQCFIGYQANELTYKSGAPTFIDGTTSQAYTKGERYRVDFGGTRAVYVCIASATFVASDLVCRADGSLINSSDLEILRPESLYGGSWGDDNKIKVTADGSDTFVDLNDNTNLSVSHKTTMPTGWTKNRARIGEQVEGVDL